MTKTMRSAHTLTHLSTYALLLLVSCHGRSAVGPEDLVLNSEQELPSIVETTISGMVHCPTCQAGSSMIIEIVAPTTTSLDPLVTTAYDQVGAYEAVVKLPAKTTLTVSVKVFVPGGVFAGEKKVDVPEGNSEASLTVDLDVP